MHLFSSKIETAVELAVSVAEGGSKPTPLHSIKICSTSYLEQLAAKLKAAVILKSVRGPNGGYLLAKSTEEISILDIAKAISKAVLYPPETKAEHSLFRLSHKAEMLASHTTLAEVLAG